MERLNKEQRQMLDWVIEQSKKSNIRDYLDGAYSNNTQLGFEIMKQLENRHMITVSSTGGGWFVDTTSDGRCYKEERMLDVAAIIPGAIAGGIVSIIVTLVVNILLKLFF